MTIYDNLFNYAANHFGSFSREDGVIIVTTTCVLLFFIAFGIGVYTDSQNPKTTKIKIIHILSAILSTIIGIFTATIILYGSYSLKYSTDYKITTKANNYLNVYTGDGSSIKIVQTKNNNPLITLKQWSSKNPHYVYPGDLDPVTDQPFYALILSINGHNRDYYNPETKLTFTSDDAKKAFEDSYARDFLTPTVTSIDEADLDITVQDNNLKQKKTVKTAKVAITYNFSDKGKKDYQDYLDSINTQKRKEAFRNSLKEAADDDSLWN